MKNLRQLLRRSGWLSSDSSRTRNSQKSRSDQSRRLRGEPLEKRQLLAGDIALAHNYLDAEDVDQNRAITASDALAVINFLNLHGSGTRITEGMGVSSMVDVNADHVVTASDALAVINAMNLGEGVGEKVELFLEPRSSTDAAITPTATNGGIREYTVNVGDIFYLELSYADLRTPDSQALGAFQISTDITLSQSGVLQPVLTELQTLTFDSAFNVAGQSGSFTFGLDAPVPGQTEIPAPVTITRNNFFNRGVFEVSQALIQLGYNSSQFRVTNLTRTVAAGDPPADPILQIAYRDLNLGGLNLPNPVIGGTTDPVDVRTAAPFNPDGSINGAALPSSFDVRSRNFTDDAGNTNGEFYNSRSFGTFNPSGTIDAFNEVGVLGRVVADGITGQSQFDFLVEPVDAFSIPVRFTQPVSNLSISLNPAEDVEAVLLYPGGAGTTLVQDDVLINAATGSFTISAIGVAQVPTVSVSVAPSSVLEDGAGSLVYTFSRTGATTDPLTINYSTSGTATLGIDFSGTSTNVMIPSGASSVTVSVDPTADTVVESDETVVLAITANAAVYSVSTTAGSATGTITDDDAVAGLPTVSVAVSPTSVLEDGTANLVYTFTRTGSTTSALTINYATSGTATAGTDFTGTSTSVVIPAGAASATVTVDPTADVAVEGDETVVLAISANAAVYTVSATAGSASGTITDDEGLPTISVAVSPSSVTEDGATNLVYTFTRTGATTSALTVNYATSGTATAASDFTGTSASIVIPAGAASATVTVDPTVDTTVEPDETVVLTVTANAGVYAVSGTAGSATGTILNDDSALPSVSVAVSPASVTEDGAANLVYTFTRTGATTSALTVNYTATGTATSGTDFAGTATSVVIPAGALSATVTVNPTADTVVESDETVILTISANAAVYSVGTASATGTITNDDFGPSTISVAVSPSSVVENGTPNLVYTFTRTGGSNAAALTVNYSVAGTATVGTDYTGTSTSVVFAAGAATAVVTVDPTADTLTEGNETVVLTITPNSGYVVSATGAAATGTITDPPVTNQPPIVSGPVTRTVTEDDAVATVNLLANASDSNAGDVLAVSNLTVTSGNAAGIVQNGNSLSITPSAYNSLTGGQNAVVVYGYNVTDGQGGSTPATATITITGINDAPVATNDPNLTAFAGATTRLNVLVNDNAGGGETQALTVTAATLTSGNATVAPTADGSAVNLTAPAGAVGTVTFTYTIRDAGGATATGTATVSVQDFNPSTISGAAFFDTIMNLPAVIGGATPVRDGVKSADETALGGVAIRLESGANENAINQAISRTVFTELDGSYEFSNLPPGTYRVSYVIPETIVYGRDIAGSAGADGSPNGSIVITIAEPGGSTRSGVNFTAYGTRGTGAAGSGIAYLDLLTTSYLASNAELLAMSNGGREGGTVSLSATGTQDFVSMGQGFTDVKFAEFTLNATRDSALLTIIGQDNVARTARLDSDHFVASADGRSVRFFGGQEDFTFVNSDAALIQQEFANFRNLVDQIMSSLT